MVEQEFGAQGCGPPGKGGLFEIGEVRLQDRPWRPHPPFRSGLKLLKRGAEAVHQPLQIYVGESIHRIVYVA